MLPPFEGLDEAAYWSAIQQLADTGHLPRLADARFARDVALYTGPLPAPDGQPYLAYFHAGAETRPVAESGPTAFVAGDGLNYEAQHPPLFFWLMAPAYRLLRGLPWPQHFFALRLIGWAVAFAGFSLGALVTQRVLRSRGVAHPLLLLPVAWPLLFAQFFEQFTRITNDTFCLLLVAVVWWLVTAWLRLGPSWRRCLGLGAALGAGLLTKAFFLPVGLGVTLLLVLAAMRRPVPAANWPATLAVPLLAGGIGGAWYVGAMLATGSLTGAADFIRDQRQGGVLSGLHAHFTSWLALLGVAPARYLLGVARMLIGFAWAGTWSFVHPTRLLVLPVVALAVLPLVLYARRTSRRDLPALAPVFLVAPVLAGLLYHLLTMLAATGAGSGTPGWFFHLFAGPLALLLALGWGPRRLMTPLVVYALLHTAIMGWMQAAFFSGCLPRPDGGAVDLLAATCIVDAAHLRLLAFPGLALAALIAALLALAAAAAVWRVSPATRESRA